MRHPLDGDLKGFLSSMEENTNLGVQTPVVGCSVSNTEMSARGPAGQSASPGWVPAVAWPGPVWRLRKPRRSGRWLGKT